MGLNPNTALFLALIFKIILFVLPIMVIFLTREVCAARLHSTFKTRIKLETTLLTICERDMSLGCHRLSAFLLLPIR